VPLRGKPANAIDLLVVVDNSTSMMTSQKLLAAAYPAFLDSLRGSGPVPDLHVAVTTTDMGAGAFTAAVAARAESCSHSNRGAFVTAPRPNPLVPSAACDTAGLNPGATFIQSGPDPSKNNYSGQLEDVLGCLVQQGDDGCGFEQPLAAIEAALGPAAPAGNAGFLRSDAVLAILIVTNEDDCSVPANSELFDPSDAAIDALGTFASFRCTAHGIACPGSQLPSSSGPLAGCAPDEAGAADDPLHSLTPVGHAISFLQGLKPPGQLLFEVLAAPPTPFAVDRTNFVTCENCPELSHSCVADGCNSLACQQDFASPDCSCVFGDPAVRLDAVARALGGGAGFDSICGAGYEGPMRGLASRLRARLGPPSH
jgi:hypothetical protein